MTANYSVDLQGERPLSIRVPGNIADEDWYQRQSVTEARFKNRKIKSTLRRVKGSWVEREPEKLPDLSPRKVSKRTSVKVT